MSCPQAPTYERKPAEQAYNVTGSTSAFSTTKRELVSFHNGKASDTTWALFNHFRHIDAPKFPVSMIFSPPLSPLHVCYTLFLLEREQTGDNVPTLYSQVHQSLYSVSLSSSGNMLFSFFSSFIHYISFSPACRLHATLDRHSALCPAALIMFHKHADQTHNAMQYECMYVCSYSDMNYFTSWQRMCFYFPDLPINIQF